MPQIQLIMAMTASVGMFQSGTPSTERVILTDASDFTASVTFVGSNAGAKGSLFFVGSADGGVITAPTIIDDAVLGAELFSTNTPPDASALTVDLGEFAGGTTLEFAYLITHGVNVAPTGSLFRTDTDLNPAHFAILDAPTLLANGSTRYSVGVEDIRNAVNADWDYNDVEFEVTITPVPTPGAGLLAFAGGLVGCRRRRRRIA